MWMRLLQLFAFFMFMSASTAATAVYRSSSVMEPVIVGFFLNCRRANKMGQRE